MNEKTHILSFSVTAQNRDNYANILENSLSGLDIKVRKRIIICCIELIQNNLKYNQAESINIEISRQGNKLTVNTFRKISPSEAAELITRIKSINESEVSELQVKYQSNICKEISSESTGNGLIICKLKSSNDIITNIENNILEISLNFEL